MADPRFFIDHGMIDDLRQRLTDYLAVAAGHQQHNRQWRYAGLCTLSLRYDCQDDLVALLRETCGSKIIYPFGGSTRFWRDHDNETQLQNELRIAWIKKVLAS